MRPAERMINLPDSQELKSNKQMILGWLVFGGPSHVVPSAAFLAAKNILSSQALFLEISTLGLTEPDPTRNNIQYHSTLDLSQKAEKQSSTILMGESRIEGFAI